MPNYSPATKMLLVCDYNAEINVNIFGKKIINPITAAVIAEINTAPAAISLVFLANGWMSGLAKSVMVSTAVLNASAQITNPIHKIKVVHSPISSWKIQAKIMMQMALNK